MRGVLKIMNSTKLKTRINMISSIIAVSLLLSVPSYSSTPKGEELTSLGTHSNIASQQVITYDEEPNEPRSSAGIIPTSDHFVINMPDYLLAELDKQDIREKTRQMYISAGATTALACLTLYYACITNPSDWISGTMGSFCTNTVLTGMATNFLRRDKNALQKRHAAAQK